ncbi:MAG TPA: isochorismatase family cysteine hydrolase [Elusimicrobiota bacterium]|nr:isochorismatase family cysteine hydrolase [Elusimicrobiota bacterium]
MKLDPLKTAVLALDMQEGILGFVPGAEAAVPAAARALEAARKAGALVVHVGLGFEPGWPEIGSRKTRFSMIKERGLFVKGSDSARFHPSLFKPGETVVYKQRVGAFSENSLRMILRAKEIENLVLFGIATSGIVLSTLRAASDLDFQCAVVKDACFDADAEVHRVLTEKVFAAQAAVMAADELAAAFARG